MLQEAAHNFSAAGLREGFGEPDVVGLGDRADFLADVLAEDLAQVGAGGVAGLESDEGDEGLALELVGTANNGGFGDVLIGDQSAFDFSSADAVTGDVQHVVNAADDPKVSVFVLPATVAGEVVAGDFGPVNFLVTFQIAPEAAEHAGPRFANDQLAPGVPGHGVALVVDDLRKDAKVRERRGARFGGRCAGQGRDHHRACFGLPPGVHDGAAFAADDFVIPNPRFRVDRLADRAEKAQRSEVVFLGPFNAPLHEGADGRGGGVEDGHAPFLDDAPEAVWFGPIGGPFIHQACGAIGQGAVHDVAMAGHPPDVGRAPEDVFVADVEDVFVRELGLEQIAGRRVKNALGLSGGAAGVENEQRRFTVHLPGGA